jgi:hypothetical protein
MNAVAANIYVPADCIEKNKLQAKKYLVGFASQ